KVTNGRIGSPPCTIRNLTFHDNATAFTCTRIACRLRYKIVRIGVDNNSPADDVGCRSRSNRPVFGDYFEGTGAVLPYYAIVDVTSMEFAAFRAIAVRMAHGIPVPARGCSTRCAAVAALV